MRSVYLTEAAASPNMENWGSGSKTHIHVLSWSYITGLLGEEAGGLWPSIPGEGERLRRKVVWQSCSAQREECHAVEKKFRYIQSDAHS